MLAPGAITNLRGSRATELLCDIHWLDAASVMSSSLVVNVFNADPNSLIGLAVEQCLATPPIFDSHADVGKNEKSDLHIRPIAINRPLEHDEEIVIVWTTRRPPRRGFKITDTDYRAFELADGAPTSNAHNTLSSDASNIVEKCQALGVLSAAYVAEMAPITSQQAATAIRTMRADRLREWGVCPISAVIAASHHAINMFAARASHGLETMDETTTEFKNAYGHLSCIVRLLVLAARAATDAAIDDGSVNIPGLDPNNRTKFDNDDVVVINDVVSAVIHAYVVSRQRNMHDLCASFATAGIELLWKRSQKLDAVRWMARVFAYVEKLSSPLQLLSDIKLAVQIVDSSNRRVTRPRTEVLQQIFDDARLTQKTEFVRYDLLPGRPFLQSSSMTTTLASTDPSVACVNYANRLTLADARKGRGTTSDEIRTHIEAFVDSLVHCVDKSTMCNNIQAAERNIQIMHRGCYSSNIAALGSKYAHMYVLSPGKLRIIVALYAMEKARNPNIDVRAALADFRNNEENAGLLASIETLEAKLWEDYGDGVVEHFDTSGTFHGLWEFEADDDEVQSLAASSSSGSEDDAADSDQSEPGLSSSSSSDSDDEMDDEKDEDSVSEADKEDGIDMYEARREVRYELQNTVWVYMMATLEHKDRVNVPSKVKRAISELDWKIGEVFAKYDKASELLARYDAMIKKPANSRDRTRYGEAAKLLAGPRSDARTALECLSEYDRKLDDANRHKVWEFMMRWLANASIAPTPVVVQAARSLHIDLSGMQTTYRIAKTRMDTYDPSNVVPETLPQYVAAARLLAGPSKSHLPDATYLAEYVKKHHRAAENDRLTKKRLRDGAFEGGDDPAQVSAMASVVEQFENVEATASDKVSAIYDALRAGVPRSAIVNTVNQLIASNGADLIRKARNAVTKGNVEEATELFNEAYVCLYVPRITMDDATPDREFAELMVTPALTKDQLAQRATIASEMIMHETPDDSAAVVDCHYVETEARKLYSGTRDVTDTSFPQIVVLATVLHFMQNGKRDLRTVAARAAQFLYCGHCTTYATLQNKILAAFGDFGGQRPTLARILRVTFDEFAIRQLAPPQPKSAKSPFSSTAFHVISWNEPYTVDSKRIELAAALAAENPGMGQEMCLAIAEAVIRDTRLADVTVRESSIVAFLTDNPEFPRDFVKEAVGRFNDPYRYVNKTAQEDTAQAANRLKAIIIRQKSAELQQAKLTRDRLISERRDMDVDNSKLSDVAALTARVTRASQIYESIQAELVTLHAANFNEVVKHKNRDYRAFVREVNNEVEEVEEATDSDDMESESESDSESDNDDDDDEKEEANPDARVQDVNAAGAAEGDTTESESGEAEESNSEPEPDSEDNVDDKGDTTQSEESEPESDDSNDDDDEKDETDKPNPYEEEP